MFLSRDSKKVCFVLSQLAASVLLLFSATANAASSTTTSPNYVGDDSWKFAITPYLWMLNMNGTVQVRDRRAHVDQSFSDILKDLNWAGMVFLDASKGRFGIFINALYADLANDAKDGILKVTATNNFGLLSGGISYQVYKACFAYSCSSQQISSIALSPYAGFRYTLNNTTVKASIPGFTAQRSLNENWTIPIAGLRLDYTITKAWSAILAGDIGGTNASSNYSYNAQGVIGYSPQTMLTNTTVYAGYRVLDQHYITGSGKTYYNWNMKIFGPMVGLTIRL